MYAVASAFPVRSVMLLECMITVYVVPFVNAVVGVILSVLPLIVFLNATVFPLDVLNSIQHFVPNLIDSLKLILITLFVGTFTALLTGFVLVIFGAALNVSEVDAAVVFAVLNVVISCVAKPFPARSVMQFGFNVSVYVVFFASSLCCMVYE